MLQSCVNAKLFPRAITIYNLQRVSCKEHLASSSLTVCSCVLLWWQDVLLGFSKAVYKARDLQLDS